MVTARLLRLSTRGGDDATNDPDDGRLRVLKASKGALIWSPRNKQRAYMLGWDAFDGAMREQGRRERALR